MSVLPQHPDLDQLRSQAKDLLRAARSGDPAAIGRLEALAAPPTLATAQLAIARDHGFSSWAALKVEVSARRAELAATVAAFCEASIRDSTGRAARMLAAVPQISEQGLGPAIVLGDAVRVRAALDRSPNLANRPDPRTGWAPLHAVAASRWHRLDPARAGGLLEVATLLLDAGADPNAATSSRPGRSGCWTPVRCAVAGAGNPAITRLLLERGARPEEHDLYLACFADDDRACLRLLLEHVPQLAADGTALSAPISTGDTESVRMLLDAGADPRPAAPADLYGVGYEDDPPWPPVYAAVRAGAPAELVRLLLERGADPDAVGPDGASPYRLALRSGHEQLVALLREFGVAEDAATVTEQFVAACLRADRAAAQQRITDDPELVGRLTEKDMGNALMRAAHADNGAAVALMLDLGFLVEARDAEDGATALHAAAYAGSATVVRLLIERGCDLESRDASWDSTALGWAKVGSGERPRLGPAPDYAAAVRALLDAGASTDGITLSPDDIKPASSEVTELLRGQLSGEERDARDQ